LAEGRGAILHLVPHDPDLLRAPGEAAWGQTRHGRPVLADHTQAWDAQDRVSRPLLLALEEGRLSDAHPIILDLLTGGVTTVVLDAKALLPPSQARVRRSLQQLTKQDGPEVFTLDKVPGPGASLPADATTGPVELSVGLAAEAGVVIRANGQAHALSDDGSSPLDVPGDGVRWARIQSEGHVQLDVGGIGLEIHTPADWAARTHAIRLVTVEGELLRITPRSAPMHPAPPTGGGLGTALGWGGRAAAWLYMLWGLLGVVLLRWGLRRR
jgi:hypothetical protein